MEQRPRSGTYITAVVGGLASQLGLDDSTTNGVGPYSGAVIPDAVVHIFSKVGTGETDVENLCAVTAHEVGHALGLDHEVYCGDVMSYYLDQCGARKFLDVAAPCGEDEGRDCGNAAAKQNSFRLLAKNVGLRDPDAATPAPPPAPKRDPDVDADAGDDGDDTDDGDVQPPPPPAARQPAQRDPWGDDDAPAVQQDPGERPDPWGNTRPSDPGESPADTTDDPAPAAAEDDDSTEAQVQYDEIRTTRTAVAQPSQRAHRHDRAGRDRVTVIHVRWQHRASHVVRRHHHRHYR